MKAQTTLVIFSLHNDKDHRLDVFHKRIIYNPIIGIEIWKITNNANKLEFHDMGAGIEDPSINKSYMVFVDLMETFFKFLFKFTKINSNGKWIFIFDNHTVEDVTLVFEEAWNKYTMLNILGVLVIDQKLQFCLYNPFQFNSKGVRGVFHYFEFYEWNKADEIYKDRLNNLYGYPMRVINNSINGNIKPCRFCFISSLKIIFKSNF